MSVYPASCSGVNRVGFSSAISSTNLSTVMFLVTWFATTLSCRCAAKPELVAISLLPHHLAHLLTKKSARAMSTPDTMTGVIRNAA